jgi:hypothetical protein
VGPTWQWKRARGRIGLNGPKGQGRGSWGSLPFSFSEFSNSFFFCFLFWIQIQTCHKLKQFKHMHQTKEQSKFSMVQHFMTPIGFDIVKMIYLPNCHTRVSGHQDPGANIIIRCAGTKSHTYDES